MEQTHNPRHSILVLTYTRPDLIQARLDELVRFYNFRDDVEIIIFDNGSESTEMRLATMPPPTQSLVVHTIREHPNVGFGGGWNRAVSFAQGENIYMLSDDVEVRGDFIAPASHKLDNAHREILVGQSLIIQGGWNVFGPTVIPYLMGHFYAMRRETWDKIGGFDSETFYPYDFEDVDLSYRATKEGIKLYPMPQLPLHHALAGTIGYNDARTEHTVKMRAAFAEKWNLPNEPERP